MSSTWWGSIPGARAIKRAGLGSGVSAHALIPISDVKAVSLYLTSITRRDSITRRNWPSPLITRRTIISIRRVCLRTPPSCPAGSSAAAAPLPTALAAALELATAL